MSVDTNDKVREQDKEITDLKIQALRNELALFRDDVKTHLNLILEQTSKTNGSVARVVKEISDIKDREKEVERALDELQEHKKGTSLWYTIQTNKWIALLAALACLALSTQEVREVLIKFLT